MNNSSIIKKIFHSSTYYFDLSLIYFDNKKKDLNALGEEHIDQYSNIGKKNKKQEINF